ncbi:MAG TPA: hypothetical protein VE449_06610 [Thermoleophilaceae bacterium]|nr:hypothetical protein [Thermoleophilaceae bacterium]
MGRLLLALLAAVLATAGPAHAKGPHAILTPGDDPAEAGRPWRVTLEVVEFRGLSRVDLLAQQGTREVTAPLRRVWADPQGAARYEARLTFPSEGRWTLLALSGKRRFNFEAVRVGSGRVPPPYVAFAVGSRAEREGAGGVYHSSGDPVPGDGGRSLPAREFSVAAEDGEDGGGGLALWILPAAGIVLVGAGVLRLRSR